MTKTNTSAQNISSRIDEITKTLKYEELSIRERISLHKEVLEIVKTNYGENNLTCLNHSMALAKLLYGIDEYQEAIKHSRVAEEISYFFEGQKVDITYNCMKNTATYFEKMGDYNNAAKKLRQALAVAIDTYGKDHTIYYQTLSKLIDCMVKQGEYSEAIGFCLLALEYVDQSRGGKVQALVKYNHIIATGFDAIGYHTKALMYHVEAAGNATAIRNKLRPIKFIQILEGHARCLAAVGMLREATSVWSKALDHREAHNEDKNMGTVECLEAMAKCYGEMGNPNMMNELKEEAQELRQSLQS